MKRKTFEACLLAAAALALTGCAGGDLSSKGGSAKTETQAVTEAKTETQAVTEAKTETQAATEAQTETQAATEAQTETQAATEAQTETQAATEAQTETQAATEAQTETQAATEAQTETAQIISETAATVLESDNTQPNTIVPEASYVDLSNLNECTAAVSFAEGDAYVDENGQKQLKVTVYDYDLYDMVDISLMKVGDLFTICQQTVTVNSLESTESGAILINGGVDEGGYTLVAAEESTVYYAMGYDDAKYYYEIGEAVIPVSDSFVFTDSSNLETGTATYTAEEFFDAETQGITYNFTPYNTSIRIENGYAVEMTRVYTP